MELALNLVWVCLALSGIALLWGELSRSSENESRRSSNHQKIIAMICTLIILFFVVSMTDDLHDQEVVVEDSRILRVVGAPGSRAVSAAHSLRFEVFRHLFAIAHSSFTFELTTLICPVTPAGPFFMAADLSPSLQGRAPPITLS